MHRLLIVDDEPLIVNGLVDFFTQLERWPLEVYGALSAEEALELLGKTRMDIVISDIGMPDMDGLELQKRIVRQWPLCKVIFLTGYNDFGYIQEAMRHQGFDYVLKAEGDEAVLKALEKAIEQTREDFRKEELLLQADKQLRLAIPSLQKELLLNILQGDLVAVARLDDYFAELQVLLDARMPVIAVLLRVDHFRRDYSIYDRSLLVYSIQNIACEYLQTSVRVVPVELDRSRMMLLIQPSEENEDAAERWGECIVFVKGCLELIQQTCKELLNMPLSFIMKEQTLPWAELGGLFEEYTRMLSQGLGMGEEILWIYREGSQHGKRIDGSPVHSGQMISQLDRLRLHLQNGQQEAFEAVLAEFLREGAERAAEPWIRQEIFYSLVPIFLAHRNRHYAAELGTHADFSKLTAIEAHASWQEAMGYFGELANVFFTDSRGGLEQEENVVVQTIQKFVQDHLDGDLSLVRIGDMIGHNSKYLSRLYKKIAGEDLSAYISRAKLTRAQSLLKESSMKIYEISNAVGFLSEPYFYRFFRKATGMTPQEYRELHGG